LFIMRQFPRKFFLLLLLALAMGPAAYGKGRARAAPKPASRRHSAAVARKTPRAPKCIGCARDSKGRIRRSRAATGAFRKSHPCPATGKMSGGCPGYVIDHVVPLKRGGADAPTNMQWQTRAAAKAKDKVE
jgi:hypothetical protein